MKTPGNRMGRTLPTRQSVQTGAPVRTWRNVNAKREGGLAAVLAWSEADV